MPLLKKVLMQGLPAGLALLFLSAITEQAGIPAYVSHARIDITGWMISTLAYNFMIVIIFAFVYNLVEGSLKGDNAVTKGLTLGFIAWLLGSVPSFINNFLQNPALHEFLKLDFITAFVGYPLMGAIIAIIGARYFKPSVFQKKA